MAPRTRSQTLSSGDELELPAASLPVLERKLRARPAVLKPKDAQRVLKKPPQGKSPTQRPVAAAKPKGRIVVVAGPDIEPACVDAPVRIQEDRDAPTEQPVRDDHIEDQPGLVATGALTVAETLVRTEALPVLETHAEPEGLYVPEASPECEVSFNPGPEPEAKVPSEPVSTSEQTSCLEPDAKGIPALLEELESMDVELSAELEEAFSPEVVLISTVSPEPEVRLESDDSPKLEVQPEAHFEPASPPRYEALATPKSVSVCKASPPPKAAAITSEPTPVADPVAPVSELCRIYNGSWSSSWPILQPFYREGMTCDSDTVIISLNLIDFMLRLENWNPILSRNRLAAACFFFTSRLTGKSTTAEQVAATLAPNSDYVHSLLLPNSIHNAVGSQKARAYAVSVEDVECGYAVLFEVRAQFESLVGQYAEVLDVMPVPAGSEEAERDVDEEEVRKMLEDEKTAEYERFLALNDDMEAQQQAEAERHKMLELDILDEFDVYVEENE